MFTTLRRLGPKHPYANLDYARHMPKAYVEKMKRTIQRKVYDNRFGAPAMNTYHIHPNDYVPSPEGRPWEGQQVFNNIARENKYFSYKVDGATDKKFEYRMNPYKRIPDEDWTIFVGDTVQVMIGKDRGKQGTVCRVLRDSNTVLVDGMHTKLDKETNETMKEQGFPEIFIWKEQARRFQERSATRRPT